MIVNYDQQPCRGNPRQRKQQRRNIYHHHHGGKYLTTNNVVVLRSLSLVMFTTIVGVEIDVSLAAPATIAYISIDTAIASHLKTTVTTIQGMDDRQIRKYFKCTHSQFTRKSKSSFIRKRVLLQQPIRLPTFLLNSFKREQRDANVVDDNNSNSMIDDADAATSYSTFITSSTVLDDDPGLVSLNLSSDSTTASSSTETRRRRTEEGKDNAVNQRFRGIIILCTVPVIWGTYTPIIKYVSTILHPSIPGILFSTLYYIVGSISLWLLILITKQLKSLPEGGLLSDETVNQKMLLSSSEESAIVAPTCENSTANSIISNSDSDYYWQGGIELGSYLFIANIFQIIGLQTVAADRAGFLIQLTTVFVPILEALSVLIVLSSHKQQRQVPTDLIGTTATSTILIPPTILPVRTWFACFLAFLGVILFDFNVRLSDAVAPQPFLLGGGIDLFSYINMLSQNAFHVIYSVFEQSSFSIGDTYIVLASVLYSVHVVRLGRYASKCDALPLAASKVTVEAMFSVGLVCVLLLMSHTPTLTINPTGTNGFLNYLTDTGHEIKTYISQISSTINGSNQNDEDIRNSIIIPVSGAILWSGCVTCAYTVFAQSYGQNRVQPTDANLIYSIQPICTAAFAYLLLGETLSKTDIIGASLILIAVYIIAVGNEREWKDIYP